VQGFYVSVEISQIWLINIWKSRLGISRLKHS